MQRGIDFHTSHINESKSANFHTSTPSCFYLCTVPKYENKRIQQKKFEDKRQRAVIELALSSVYMRSLLEAHCADFGVTLSQFNILRILRGAQPDGFPRAEIIKRMIDKSDVTRLIDKLEKQKLVRRSFSETDKRHSLTLITPKGLRLLEQLLPGFEDLHEKLFGSFTADELDTLAVLLKRVYRRDK